MFTLVLYIWLLVVVALFAALFIDTGLKVFLPYVTDDWPGAQASFS